MRRRGAKIASNKISGAVKIEVHQTYPLKDAAKAHADLAARKTTGSTVLTV
jgi:NADPH2:quinone reductase